MRKFRKRANKMIEPTRGQIVTFLSYLYLAALGSYLLYTSYGLVGAIVGLVLAIPVAVIIGALAIWFTVKLSGVTVGEKRWD